MTSFTIALVENIMDTIANYNKTDNLIMQINLINENINQMWYSNWM